MTWIGRWMGWTLVAVVGCGAETGPSGDASTGSASGEGSGSEGPVATSGPQVCEDGGDGWADDGFETGTGGDGTSGGGPIGMDDDMPLVTSVPDIQQGLVDADILVQLDDMVVVSPPTSTETGEGTELFVQDPAGGPWSGLRVRLPNPGGLPQPGDAVRVVGRVLEREGFFLVEVSETGEELVTTGSATPPPPVVVSVADLRLDDAQGRPYEGVPIRVEQVAVTDDDPCDGEFVIEDTARVDDRFAPGQIDSPSAGATLDAVEGVLVYAEDSFEIAPRDPGEVQ